VRHQTNRVGGHSAIPVPDGRAMPDVNGSVDVLSGLLASLNSAPLKPSMGETDPTNFFERAFASDNDAMPMTIFTITLTVVLELASVSTVFKICRNKAGKVLYAQGICCNIINNCVLGPIAYEIVNSHFMTPPWPMQKRIILIGAILLGHSVGYYCAHRWMHTKRMYWAHRFHHRFNTHVVPLTANAVSIVEYFLAYMLPFVVGSAIVRPDRLSLFVGVGIISVNNLLIHTPGLSALSARLVPWWGVSTADHLEHHQRLTTHWAAPTISIDRLLACVVGKPASWGKEFKED